jgi:hypothetical protein
MGLHRPTSYCPLLESLEDRFLLSVAASLTRSPDESLKTSLAEYGTASLSPRSVPFAAAVPVRDHAVPGAPTAPEPGHPRERVAARDDEEYDTPSHPHRESPAVEFIENRETEARALVNSLLLRSSHARESANSDVMLSETGGRPPSEASVVPAHPHVTEQPPTVLAPVETPFPRHVPSPEGLATLFAFLSANAEPVTAQQPADVPTPLAHRETTTALLPESGGPLAGVLSLDVDTLQRNMDAFFSQMADLVRGPEGASFVRKVAPWVLIGSVVAWEVVLLPRVLRRERRRAAHVAADPLPLWIEDET